jgi:mannosyltransferase OCH1-like enzyme
MIPKIIHQSYKDKDIPHFFQQSPKLIKELMPDWDYQFWSDEDLDKFIKEAYPDSYDMWLTLTPKIKRIDVSRYYLLHYFGGIYMDMDFHIRKDLEPLLTGASIFSYKSYQAVVKGWHFFGNAFMASNKGEPFWLDLIQWIYEQPNSDDVLYHTGPMGIGNFLVGKPYNTCVFSHDIFDNSQCGDGIGKGEYGVHHRTATWQRNKEL